MDIKTLLKEKAQVNLDISNLDPSKGFIKLYEKDADIVHDLNTLPYPLPDSSVDFIKCINVVEKINRTDKGFIKWMDEMWRILKPDSQMAISTVYGTSHLYYQDPTNVNPINEATFVYFDPLEKTTAGAWYKLYKPKPWRMVTILFQVGGQIEILLEKRLEDSQYYE